MLGNRRVVPWSLDSSGPASHANNSSDEVNEGGLAGKDMIERLIDAFHSCVMIVDSSQRVVKYSPPTALMGLIRGQDLVHDELRALVRAARRDQTDHEAQLVLTRDRFADATISVSARTSPLGEGYVALFVEDRTRAQRVEDVRRDFVANVSHELKTPVGGISLLAEAVLDASDDPETVARFARRILVESNRLTHLVQDIVDLSRLQADEEVTEPVPVRICDVVQEAIDGIATLAESQGVRIATRIDPTARVLGDHRMLTVAVANLLSNAVNYSAERTRVAVTARVRKAVVEIAVADQGTGIAEDMLDRIFERFFRIDKARSRATGGTGLGLAIVKHVCTNHGGEVDVWSKLGEGSTFTIRLPAVPPEGSELDAVAAAAAIIDASNDPPSEGRSLPARDFSTGAPAAPTNTGASPENTDNGR